MSSPLTIAAAAPRGVLKPSKAMRRTLSYLPLSSVNSIYEPSESTYQPASPFWAWAASAITSRNTVSRGISRTGTRARKTPCPTSSSLIFLVSILLFGKVRRTVAVSNAKSVAANIADIIIASFFISVISFLFVLLKKAFALFLK